MKNLLLIISGCLISIHSVSQWSNINSGTNELLLSISSPSADTVYCLSESGVLHGTTNGGTNWNTLNTLYAYRIFFQSNLIGFAYGGNELLKTIDGGQNWNPVLTLDISKYVYGLSMINQNEGYACSMNLSDSVSTYYTSDGGDNWNLISNDVNNIFDIATMYFWDVNTGFIGNWNGQLFKTSDGGLNWNEVYATSGMINDIFFTSPTVGFGVADMEFIKTIDGGDNWTGSVPPFSSIYAALAITPNGTIHVTGGNGLNTGTLIKSINNGTNWTQTGTSVQSYYDVDFVNDSTGYACGTNGSMLKFGISTIGIPNPNETDLQNDLFSVYPNPVNSYLNILDHKSSAIYSMKIYNSVGGQLIFQNSISTIDLSNFSNGIYFLEIQSNEGIFREKIIKQ